MKNKKCWECNKDHHDWDLCKKHTKELEKQVKEDFENEK